MQALQKIVFVSIILLIGLFSLQLNLRSKTNFYLQSGRSLDLKKISHQKQNELKEYNGPLIFPTDTIKKYYLNNDHSQIQL